MMRVNKATTLFLVLAGWIDPSWGSLRSGTKGSDRNWYSEEGYEIVSGSDGNINSNEYEGSVSKQRNMMMHMNGDEMSGTDSPTIAEAVPSFDGDLDAILALALQQAALNGDIEASISTVPSDSPSLAPTEVGTDVDDEDAYNEAGSTMPSDAPSLVPSTMPSSLTDVGEFDESSSSMPSDYPSLTPSSWGETEEILSPTSSPTFSAAPTNFPLLNPHSCNEVNAATTTYMLLVSYTYSLEIVPNAEADVVAGEGEEILQEMVGPRSLYCLSPLAESANIAALDSRPLDIEDNEQFCSSEVDIENSCSVWTGKMRFFLTDQSSATEAADLAVAEIKSIIESQEFVEQVGSGLVQAKFLEALIDDIAPVQSSGNIDDAINSGNMGLTAVVLVAVAGSALIVMVGSVYYWRRSYGRAIPSGAATQAAGSSLNHTNDSSMLTATHPTSPFSEMVRGADGFTENMSILSGRGSGMSAIIEDEERSHTSASLVISDTGYSTEAAGGGGGDNESLLSMDVPKSLYTRTPESPNLLGARKRNPHSVLGDDMSDLEASEDEMSDTGNSPSRKRGAGNIVPLALLGATGDGSNPSAKNGATTDPNDSMHADEMLLFC